MAVLKSLTARLLSGVRIGPLLALKRTPRLSAQLSDTSGYADTIAYKLFGDAYYDTETWLGWNGLAESETTYYDLTNGR